MVIAPRGRLCAMFDIFPAQSAAHLAGVRRLFQEYADALGFDLCFQNFAEELATLPGAYARPNGALLLATAGADYAGCVALRHLDASICEMKRLYVRPAFRRHGLGRRLSTEVIQIARDIGCERMRLDTMRWMTASCELYRALGFAEIPPYYPNPIDGAVYFEFDLQRNAPGA
jgi:ribosomal protein S18 acetylase RimI-like enzyme